MNKAIAEALERGASGPLGLAANYLHNLDDPKAKELAAGMIEWWQSMQRIMPQAQGPWDLAATVLGWRWSSAHGGYIHDEHLENGEHPSELTAEDACFLFGVETEESAAEKARLA